MYNNEQGYLQILSDVLKTGYKKSVFGHEDTYILSKLGTTIHYDCSDGLFPLMTTRRINWQLGLKEILWFIGGTKDVALLHRQGCKFWDDWAAKYTKQSLEQWQSGVDSGEITSTVVPLHYSNATHWDGYLDQTKWVIDNIKKTPDRKSFLVSYWNPTQVYQMADLCGNESVSLPACHYSYTLNVTEGRLSLVVIIRSQDLVLGHPTNVAQYAALLNMYSICTGFPVAQLIVQMIDYHLYSNHTELVQEVVTREPRQQPLLHVENRGQRYLQDFVFEDFSVTGYKPYPYIKGDITVVGGY